MTAPTSPLPASLLRAERESHADLDVRIRLAEQRLIAREENLRRGVAALGQRVRDKARPWRRRLPLAAVVLAGVGAWWFWSRRGRGGGRGRDDTWPDDDAPRQSQQQQHSSLFASIPWMSLLTLGWPLLPERWRARVSPGTVGTVLSMAVPLLGRLFQRRPRRRAPPPRRA